MLQFSWKRFIDLKIRIQVYLLYNYVYDSNINCFDERKKFLELWNNENKYFFQLYGII